MAHPPVTSAVPSRGSRRLTIRTIVHKLRSYLSTGGIFNNFPYRKYRACESPADLLAAAEFSTAAQLRRFGAIADITPFTGRPIDGACFFCGERYAPPGFVAMATVLGHFLECDELAARRAEAAR